MKKWKVECTKAWRRAVHSSLGLLLLCHVRRQRMTSIDLCCFFRKITDADELSLQWAGFSYSSDKNGRKRKSFSELGRSAMPSSADGASTACAMASNGHG